MKQLKAELVVIGGGGAGLVAALNAQQKGIQNIVILEKRFVVGGNSSMAGGMVFAAESKQQKEQGVDVNRDKVFKDTMAFHHYDRVNPRIIRAFIDKSASTIQWLEDNGALYEWKMGVHMLKDTTTPFGGFSRVIKIMAEKFKQAGGEILVNTSAKNIQRDAQGKVSKVIAESKDGEEVIINTRSVILSTGGFTGNRALLKDYFPHHWDEVYWTDAVPLDGDGIKLAESAGAGIEDYCTLIRENGYCFDKSGKMPNRIHMEEGAVWVNKNGIRYIDETVHENPGANALLMQPGKIAYALFDDNLIEKANNRPNPMVNLHKNEKKTDLRETLKEEDKIGKWCRISDNWEDIAEWIQSDPSVLKKTIEEYNSFCDQERDAVFAKDKNALIALRKPPYYAIKFRPLMIDTAGPVKIDEFMEVLDAKDKPIPGFYAAGVITSGWQGYDYRLFGSALGYSLTSGRIAGDSVVNYLTAEK